MSNYFVDGKVDLFPPSEQGDGHEEACLNGVFAFLSQFSSPESGENPYCEDLSSAVMSKDRRIAALEDVLAKRDRMLDEAEYGVLHVLPVFSGSTKKLIRKVFANIRARAEEGSGEKEDIDAKIREAQAFVDRLMRLAKEGRKT